MVIASTFPKFTQRSGEFSRGSVIGTLSPTGPHEFATNVGLTGPGNLASFKVYIITSTGNEKGSNTVTRPAGPRRVDLGR